MLRSLFYRTGSLGRKDYALAGAVLLAVKYNLDRVVSEGVFTRPFSPLSYLDVASVGRITSLAFEDAAYCAALVALAFPFVWVGTVLTFRRLRDAGLPGWLVLLFFVPLVNLLLFAALCVVPTATESEHTGRSMSLGRWVPRSKVGSAAASVVVTVGVAIGFTLLAVDVFGQYGWGVFVGIPFTVGMLAAVLYGYREPRTLGESVGVGALALSLGGAGLLTLAVEGVICLVMAAPLAYPIAALGAAVGHAFTVRSSDAAPRAAGTMLLLLPGFFGLEAAVSTAPPRWVVRTAVEIAAPPAVVWEHVVAFSTLPPPEDWLFRTGIAYPTHATIEGRGVGAVRRCEFTTGTFVEPITIWDAPRRLAFDVVDYPEPMVERNPFGAVHPPHLDGAFVSEQGQFLLTPLPSGGTLLEGTTWYRHELWPSGYWRLWSDFILHRVHDRVLRHVKRLSESA